MCNNGLTTAALDGFSKNFQVLTDSVFPADEKKIARWADKKYPHETERQTYDLVTERHVTAQN